MYWEQKKEIDTLLELDGQKDLMRRSSILGQQAGAVQKALNYMVLGQQKTSADLKDFTYEKAMLKDALSDYFIQGAVVAQLFDIDVDELLAIGVNRLAEFKKTNFAGLQLG